MFKYFLIIGLLITNSYAFSTSCSQLNIPNLSDTITYSGYLNISDTSESALAFIFYGMRGQQIQDLGHFPLTIWLQGGPGDSAQMANFFGVGPLSLVNNHTNPEVNPYSWNNFTNLLFIDAPVGTGFSPLMDPKDAPTTDEAAIAQLWYGISEFFNSGIGCLSNVQTMRESNIYVFGEHYAAKFAVGLASQFLNSQFSNMKLAGVGLGDPLINLVANMNNYGFYGYYLGLLDNEERTKIQGYTTGATIALNMGNYAKAYDLFYKALIDIVLDSGGVSPYNIYNLDGYALQMYTQTNNYFEDKGNMALYNFSDVWGYSVENLNITNDFSNALLLGAEATKELENILSKDVNVLIYNGQWDLVSNNPGYSSWTDQLNYKEQDSFKQREFSPLYLPDSKNVFGSYKEAGNLKSVIINQSGRFSNLDQPAVLNYLATLLIQ